MSNANATPDALPALPLTIEGSWVLHQMFRIEDRSGLEGLGNLIAGWENATAFSSAAYAVIGNKADLMLVHFRESMDELLKARQAVAKAAAGLAHVYSYLSVVELGLYESTVKTYKDLKAKGVEPHGEEWSKEIGATLDRQREAMKPRLFPPIPDAPYLCFYPMDRLRGEHKNWYTEPIENRQRMMHEHGMVGRRYAGEVKQIITGSIGLDDWEWGVDLFASDPLVFKRLIYEMRFDEVSAVYAKFGQFFVGRRVPGGQLAENV